MTARETSPVDALRFPLHGLRLIEASAGTGKTWTIAALYVRMALGHGMAAPLLPPNILVVTFTEAATQELRERIRSRLVDAARCFAGLIDGDAFLQSLRGDYPAQSHAICAQQLERAAQWMDEAAIHTIHAWCQRMLTRHAFVSGSAFAQSVEQDNSELLADCVRDWWRRRLYPLDPPAFHKLMRLWATPDALLKTLHPLLADPETCLRVDGAALQPVDDWPAVVAHWQDWKRASAEQWNAVRALWAADRAAIDGELLTALDRGALHAGRVRPDRLRTEIAALDDWSQSPGSDTDIDFSRYTSAFLQEVTKKNCAPPSHPVFDAVAHAIAADAEEPDLHYTTLADALAWVRQRFDERQQRLAKIGFNDMLVRLDRALRGDHGETLAAAIRDEFPLALIDEFQDTDSCQYRIFRAIWNMPDSEQGGLILVGDPKQAIYAFRGADIHTYLRARDEAVAHYSLAVNHRSTHAMVDAVNRLFAGGEALADDGAFAFGERGLPFFPVSAQGRREQLRLGGAVHPALTVWHLDGDETINRDTYIDAMAGGCADAIVGVLGDPGNGFVDGDAFRRVQPSDIAVLVRNHRDAETIRDALSRRRLRSVYLSDQQSVFASGEAQDLLLWLRACAEPGSDRRLRAALATATLGISFTDIDRLGHDEEWREQLTQRFHDLHATGTARGVLAMLHDLLHRFDLPARLLARDGGERRLTNLLHLAELLQQAEQTEHGDAALIRHLEAAIADVTAADDTRIVRLESDAGLIRVVTIHKSKGLEYPLVFLPFAAVFGQVRGEPRYHDGEQRSVELSSDKASTAVKRAREIADRERLQEDLRLLYVAVTRARHALWLGVTDLRFGNSRESQLHKGALGYLLNGGAPIGTGELARKLIDWRGDGDSVAIDVPPSSGLRAPRWQDAQSSLAAARVVSAPRVPPWWISSYSALRKGDAKHTLRAPSPDTPTEDVLVEYTGTQRDHMTAAATTADGIHAFPRGADPGTFLHGLFEWAAAAGFAAVANDPGRFTDIIKRRCERRGWQHWIAPLSRWLPQLLRTPLALPGGGQVALAALARPHGYQAELEFWIEAHEVSAQRVDQLVSRYTLDGISRNAIQPDRLNGLFKGYVDLVFVHEGRYHVLDYKSNRLGEAGADYTLARMRESILAERYDLQYALYLLALHRQLTARLPGYDPTLHLGGAVYVYLRGVDGEGHGVHVERPPLALIEALDQLFTEGTNADAG